HLSSLTINPIAQPQAEPGRVQGPTGRGSKINFERQTNTRGRKTFKQLFADELYELLAVMSPEIEKSFKPANKFLNIDSALTQMDAEARRMCVNLIHQVVTRGLDRQAIPSQRIRAALHATIRLDDKRSFKENDLPDIAHSSVAMAYCNVFLTEHCFANLLRRPPVCNVIASDCKVISDLSEAIASLS
ncbi:MAG: hypothetical protein JWQ71_159, partial [Pedosphaera sp.]|nr:hypothetical protein [Pedosphaera sp.]